jgi:NADH-quinone oxidoreductase subunit G
LGIKLEIEHEISKSIHSGNRFQFERNQSLRNTAAFTPLGELKTDKLAATFSHSLFDQAVRMKHDPHLIKMSKKPQFRISPKEGEKKGLKDEQRVQVSAHGHAIHGQIKFDANVAMQTVVLPLGYEQEIPVHNLGAYYLNGLEIEIRGSS